MNESLTPELPDFDDPLGMLHACHERMLEHCDILEQLVPHIADKGVDSEARSAASKRGSVSNPGRTAARSSLQPQLFRAEDPGASCGPPRRIRLGALLASFGKGAFVTWRRGGHLRTVSLS